MQGAGQGNADAQNSLGVAYSEGEGVLEDDVVGYAWYNIAALNGDLHAKRNKDILAKEMSLELVSVAQKLSKEMVKKNPKLVR
jgi:hypothetical protein